MHIYVDDRQLVQKLYPQRAVSDKPESASGSRLPQTPHLCSSSACISRGAKRE